METFSAIDFSIAGNVRIIEGETQKVEVTGPKDVVDIIYKSVKFGVWRIKLLSGFDKNYDKLDIIITSNIIDRMIINGSGNITADNVLPISFLKNTGSGNFDLKTKSTSLYMSIYGSGNITVSGTADMISFASSSSGNFHGFNLIVADATVQLSGSGNAEVFVTTNLNVKINNSGNVYYKGTPNIIKQIVGSGSVINAN